MKWGTSRGEHAIRLTEIDAEIARRRAAMVVEDADDSPPGESAVH